ncbi:MAG: hypothetical protein EOP88_20540 [Verrucomicrobiaceae bacterium]|nr:MAG: hypothetical protein EOP88_20540 [Verrucomicrobiaceae bacterium]
MKKPHYIIMGGIVVLLPVVYLVGSSRGPVGQTENKAAQAKSEAREEGRKPAPREKHPDSPGSRHQARIEAEMKAAENMGMTPELAAARLKAAQAIENIHERAMVCAHIIGELCAAGYVNEAWAFIDKDFGKVRSAELDTFFASPMVNLATFEATFKELYNDAETRSAMSSRMEIHKTADLLDSLMSPQVDSEFLALKKLDPEGFSNGVYNRLHLDLRELPILEREGRLSEAFALQQKGLLRPVEPVRMLWKLGNYDAFQKWEKFSEFTAGTDFGSDRDYIEHTRESFIGDMIRESSLQTIDLILKSEGAPGSRDLQLAMQQWSKVDSSGAMEWYEKNASTLGPEKQSSAAAGFFGLAYDNGELEVARQWANQITEQKMREGALAAIDKKEREQQGR